MGPPWRVPPSRRSQGCIPDSGRHVRLHFAVDGEVADRGTDVVISAGANRLGSLGDRGAGGIYVAERNDELSEAERNIVQVDAGLLS